MEKSFLSFIILVHVGIPYSGKFFLTAESLWTNAVIITRVLCTWNIFQSLFFFFFQGDDFGDFQFDFLYTEPYVKSSLLWRIGRVANYEQISTDKGYKKSFMTAPLLICVSIPLNYAILPRLPAFQGCDWPAEGGVEILNTEGVKASAYGMKPF